MPAALAVTILQVLALIEEITGLKLGLTQTGVEEILSVLTIVAVWLMPGRQQIRALFNR